MPFIVMNILIFTPLSVLKYLPIESFNGKQKAEALFHCPEALQIQPHVTPKDLLACSDAEGGLGNISLFKSPFMTRF